MTDQSSAQDSAEGSTQSNHDEFAFNLDNFLGINLNGQQICLLDEVTYHATNSEFAVQMPIHGDPHGGYRQTMDEFSTSSNPFVPMPDNQEAIPMVIEPESPAKQEAPNLSNFCGFQSRAQSSTDFAVPASPPVADHMEGFQSDNHSPVFYINQMSHIRAESQPLPLTSGTSLSPSPSPQSEPPPFRYCAPVRQRSKPGRKSLQELGKTLQEIHQHRKEQNKMAKRRQRAKEQNALYQIGRVSMTTRERDNMVNQIQLLIDQHSHSLDCSTFRDIADWLKNLAPEYTKCPGANKKNTKSDEK